MADTFLFQTGSIKSVFRSTPISFAICFYSKLVRLKVRFAHLWDRSHVFLFQTGSIKSYENWWRRLKSWCLFLFQTGSIKSIAPQWVFGADRCFYSKLVRLKGKACDYYLPKRFESFYSKLVRLKVPCVIMQFATMLFLFQTGSIKSKSSAEGKKWKSMI